jgi:hypothetical protein
VRSSDGSNVQRRTVESAGRSANSWVVGHRSVFPCAIAILTNISELFH